MTLGEISVTNGEAPKEFQLYGIVNSHSDTSYDNCIEHVNLTVAALRHSKIGRRPERFLLCSQCPGKSEPLRNT
jgi:hypothetical protein